MVRAARLRRLAFPTIISPNEGLNYPLIFWAIFMTIEMSDFAEQKGLICKNVNSEMNCIASGDKINILEDMSEENKA